MTFGINLGFALKRWSEPASWAQVVREDLGLSDVQFTLDLLDPWWPEAERAAIARDVRRAAADAGIAIHSAQLGLAWYTYNGLLAASDAERRVAKEWWKRAVATAAEIGTTAVGGPLGALTVRESADPAFVERRYAQLLDDMVEASEDARAAGLSAVLVEPTPLPREIPSTVAQTRRLLDDLAGRTAVPISLVIDVGHALYRPLYGDRVTLGEWLAPLAPSVGVLHLQNHDYRSDSHWGWPDDRAAYDVAAFAAEARASGCGDVPVFLELFFPFEMSDAEVLAKTRSSVEHCAAILGAR